MKIKVELIVEYDTDHELDIAMLGDEIANTVMYGPLPGNVDNIHMVTCTRVETHN